MTNRATLLATTAIVISIIAISTAILPVIAASQTGNTVTTTTTIPYTTTVPYQSKTDGELNFISSGTATTVGTILVSGTGIVKSSPDTVSIQMGVFTQAKEVQYAVEQNAEIFQRILSALNNVGVSKESVETVSYSIIPVYEYPQYSSPVLVGYRVDHQVVVTSNATQVDELGMKAGKIIDAAFSSGANELISVTFTVSDSIAKELVTQARGLAVADAKDKAKTIADGLGVNVTGVQQASESYAYYPPSTRLTGADSAKAATEILPGSLTISVSVQVTFTID